MTVTNPLSKAVASRAAARAARLSGIAASNSTAAQLPQDPNAGLNRGGSQASLPTSITSDIDEWTPPALHQAYESGRRRPLPEVRESGSQDLFRFPVGGNPEAPAAKRVRPAGPTLGTPLDELAQSQYIHGALRNGPSSPDTYSQEGSSPFKNIEEMERLRGLSGQEIAEKGLQAMDLFIQRNCVFCFARQGKLFPHPLNRCPGMLQHCQRCCSRSHRSQQCTIKYPAQPGCCRFCFLPLVGLVREAHSGTGPCPWNDVLKIWAAAIHQKAHGDQDQDILVCDFVSAEVRAPSEALVRFIAATRQFFK